MKTLAYILTLLLFITLKSHLFACGQIGDILIYNNDTLSIRDFPLEQLYNNDQEKPDFFDNYKTNRFPSNTGCRRGYQAYWIIIDNQLFLTSINSCCEPDNLKKANLKKLFGRKCINGKVRAYWFSGKVIGEIGEPILYLNFMDFLVPYEREFDFVKGHLIESKLFDNTKTKESKYLTNYYMHDAYIYKNINWDSLPKLNGEEINVNVIFSSNENGIIDSAYVQYKYNKKFDEEAIRVIKSIPEWNIYLREGKAVRVKWYRDILFNDELREQYYIKK